jgi:hypothetical protein
MIYKTIAMWPGKYGACSDDKNDPETLGIEEVSAVPRR